MSNEHPGIMSPGANIALPPEILDLVARHLDAPSPEHDETKRTSHFDLAGVVSYQAGNAYLYACPVSTTKENVKQFVRTICATGTRSNNLAAMVVTLDMTQHFHGRLDNLTASRLLTAVKVSLRNFVAPSLGFGLSSLTALSKCLRLQRLDVSSHSGRPFSFPMFKKAISNLHELEALALPRNMKLTLTGDSAGECPPRLRRLSIGGQLDLDVLQAFDWPSTLTGLTFDYSPNWSDEMIEVTLCSQETFRTSLLSLHVRWDGPQHSDEPEGTDLLYQLANLVFLRASVETTIALLWNDPPRGSAPLSIRILELTGQWGYEGFESEEMLDLFICHHLPNIQALGISRSVENAMRGLREETGRELQTRFMKNTENNSRGGGRRGLYKIDEPPSLFMEDI